MKLSERTAWSVLR